jgi:hypothetical protein
LRIFTAEVVRQSWLMARNSGAAGEQETGDVLVVFGITGDLTRVQDRGSEDI